MYITRLTILTAFFVITILLSCDAPRKNPLDPNNPDRVLLTISGLVQTISIPYLPVPNARISWQNGQITSISNEEGTFHLETVQKHDDWLFIEKSGFFHDSVFISWANGNDIKINIFLNSLPVPQELIVYASVLNRYPDLQNEQLFVEAWISDQDDDVDSVFVGNTYNNFFDQLLYNPSTQKYERSFSVTDLNIIQLEEILGYPFDFVVADKFDHNLIIGQMNLVRIIREEIFFNSPSGNDTSSARPTFVWHEFTPGFQHTYLLQIYTADITPQLVWQKDGILQDITEYTIDQDLSPGEYFWVIWAIDEFYNRVRSKPASFRVVS